ncbi:MAG: glucose-1-phosphate adenylyltransferase [Anaerolineales bacterium]
MPNTNEILSVILGGGVGKRLYPLTKMRAKPAVPIAGKYRLIDIPLSNCINSGISRIAVLTQFNSVSLHRHITQTYNFDAFHPGWVQILAAEQTPTSSDWYQGTADAVRKQINEIQSSRAKYVLILAGDHLYRMDYEAMAAYHWELGAHITVAVQPVPVNEAARFGILKRSPGGRITDFVEKPRDPEVLRQFVSRDDPERPYLGSMGIYMFNTDVLVHLLENMAHNDFGADVIPAAIDTHKVVGFDFEGYWEDIGTIRSFYDTNLSLTRPEPPFNFYDPERPIYTHARFLPGSVVNGATLRRVMMADGCRIERSELSDTLIGLRAIVGRGTQVKSSILMGADYYDAPDAVLPGGVPLGIGANCHIEGAIIDKNVRMGDGVIIKGFPRGTELEGENFVVHDGIVVIPKSSVIPAGTVIAPQDGA